MILYWIIITLIIVMWIITFLLFKLKKLNWALTSEVIKSKQTPIIIWKLNRYKESDLHLLLSNPDVIDLLLQIFEYKIAIKTDSIRSLEGTERKVWYLDCLHETHLYFDKLKQKLTKKVSENWQDLI